MSRVAKMPVTLPSSVEVTIIPGSITVKGPKGELTQHVNRKVSIVRDEASSQTLHFSPSSQDLKDREGWAQSGTARANVNNMVKGVTQGYERKLELVGVGYRAQQTENTVSLSLGYSHPIAYVLPAGVKAEIPNSTTIILKGIDKQLLGQIASEIRSYRPPEPYKGKGIKYEGEKIIRKEIKKK